VGHGPFDWPAAVAFGHFTERIVEAPGVRLRVAILDGRPKVDETQIAAWLQRAAVAVTMLYGRFPVPTAQVLVIPGVRGDEPVPLAYVLRGGRPSAHFFINQRRPMEEFNLDWSVIHELSHLLLPYVQSEDAWLSEGTASYYQNVLRARAGIIDPHEAWKRMHGGFKRGMEKIVEGLDVPIIPVHLDRLWSSVFSFEREKFVWKWPRRNRPGRWRDGSH
jgi:hypothetical protein